MSSIVELCEAAEALIAPVRQGIARPTASFSLVTAFSDNPRGSDDLFNADPLTERRRGSRHRRETQPVSSAQPDDSDVHVLPFEEEFNVVIPPDVSSLNFLEIYRKKEFIFEVFCCQFAIFPVAFTGRFI